MHASPQWTDSLNRLGFRRLVTLLVMLTISACGGSTQPNACPICGKWYLRYNPVTNQQIAHDSNLALTLNEDYTFTQGQGALGPALEGTYFGDESFVELEYAGLSSGQRRFDQLLGRLTHNARLDLQEVASVGDTQPDIGNDRAPR
jgi:hypothetical protein